MKLKAFSKLSKLAKYFTLVDILNFGLIGAMVGLICYALPNLPETVPFFYTLPWGEVRLVNNNFLFAIPLISFCLWLFNQGVRIWATEIKYLNLTVSLILLWSLFKIIAAVSPLWPHAYFDFKNIILPAGLGLITSYLLSRPLISLVKKLGLIDDPKTHQHPGMLLKKPTPRGGSLIFFLSFLICSLVVVPLGEIPWGILVGGALYTGLGLLDDKFDINPYVRFGILGLGAAIVAISGVGIKSFATPFGSIGLTSIGLYLPILADNTYLLTDIFTIFWILWVSNLLSWSNGIDGQFAGVTGLTALFIAFLSLRLIPLDHNQIQTTRIAAIAAGSSFGMIPATWNPCKVLWGFGATSAGLVLASLSVITGSKVATATLVILVPFLDAIATFIRRVSLRKSPFWGDRGHLHHHLLDAGFSQPQIALIYWGITLILGLVAVFTSGKIQTLAVMTFGIAAASLIILTNLKGRIKIPRLLKTGPLNPKEEKT